MKMNKRDFGSFLSSNVDELISLSDADYQVPEIPVNLPTFENFAGKSIPYGKEVKEKFFLLNEDYTFLNHGAFGAVVKQTLYAAQRWQEYVELQPVRFCDRELLPLLVLVIRRMAQFVGCEPCNLMLIPNVTTGMNCVLRSFPFNTGDELMYFNTEYGANKKAIQEICKEKGVEIHEQTIQFPITDANQIVEALSSGLRDRTRLVVLNHIPSNTPCIMPIKDMVDICHKRNIQVLVDGAHALGQLDLDIASLGADFYVTNCHKWFSACKGTALMYIGSEYRDIIQPLVISHGYQSGPTSKYIWTGLRDYSPYLSLLTTLEFWRSLGPSHVRQHIHSLAKQAGELLVTSWDTDLLVASHLTGSMLCVRLPSALYLTLEPVTYQHAETLQNILYHQFNIEVPIKVVNGALYVRISAHVYNTLDDYHKLVDAINTVVADNLLVYSTAH